MDSFELRLQCFCRPGSKLSILPFDILERVDKQLKIEKKNYIMSQRWQLIYYQQKQYVDMPQLELVYYNIIYTVIYNNNNYINNNYINNNYYYNNILNN